MRASETDDIIIPSPSLLRPPLRLFSRFPFSPRFVFFHRAGFFFPSSSFASSSPVFVKYCVRVCMYVCMCACVYTYVHIFRSSLAPFFTRAFSSLLWFSFYFLLLFYFSLSNWCSTSSCCASRFAPLLTHYSAKRVLSDVGAYFLRQSRRPLLVRGPTLRYVIADRRFSLVYRVSSCCSLASSRRRR